MINLDSVGAVFCPNCLVTYIINEDGTYDPETRISIFDIQAPEFWGQMEKEDFNQIRLAVAGDIVCEILDELVSLNCVITQEIEDGFPKSAIIHSEDSQEALSFDLGFDCGFGGTSLYLISTNLDTGRISCTDIQWYMEDDEV